MYTTLSCRLISMSDSLSWAARLVSDMLISLQDNVVYTQLDLVDKWNMLAQQFADWRCEVGSVISEPGKQSVTPSQVIHNFGLTATTNCVHPASLSVWQDAASSCAGAINVHPQCGAWSDSRVCPHGVLISQTPCHCCRCSPTSSQCAPHGLSAFPCFA